VECILWRASTLIVAAVSTTLIVAPGCADDANAFFKQERLPVWSLEQKFVLAIVIQIGNRDDAYVIFATGDMRMSPRPRIGIYAAAA
jgi:hypothetical protein